MAVVYSAHDQLENRSVAVKQMGSYAQSPEEAELATQQFQQEARLLHALEHPALPRVHEWFEEGGDQFLVMDLLTGRSLTLRADSTGQPYRATPVDVVAWGIQLARVLEYLHGQTPRPIIYKDLKPDNLMLEADGTIRLLDFGIAKGNDARGRYFTILKGMVTPGYAAPEQYSGTATDPRTDIYGLGATLYALLAGEPPPESVARQQQLLTGRGDPLVFPRRANPTVSPELEDAIMQMLALRRSERLQTAQVVRTILESLPEADQLRASGRFPAERGQPVAVSAPPLRSGTPDPSPEWKVVRRRAYWAAGIAMAGLIALSLLTWLLHGR